MQSLSFISISGVIIISILISCEKEISQLSFGRPLFQRSPAATLKRQERSFANVLPTRIFLDYSDSIFTISIEKSTDRILWDSALTLMKIKDIPSFTNKLVIDKSVPGNDGSLLKVGFRYSIENVGDS